MDNPQEPIMQRVDPMLVIDALSLGVNTVIGGYIVADHIGNNEPPEPAPEPPQIILPSGTDRD